MILGCPSHSFSWCMRKLQRFSCDEIIPIGWPSPGLGVGSGRYQVRFQVRPRGFLGDICGNVFEVFWDRFGMVLGWFQYLFPNQACLGVLTVQKRIRLGCLGEPVPPEPWTGSPTMWSQFPPQRNVDKKCLGASAVRSTSAKKRFRKVQKQLCWHLSCQIKECQKTALASQLSDKKVRKRLPWHLSCQIKRCQHNDALAPQLSDQNALKMRSMCFKMYSKCYQNVFNMFQSAFNMFSNCFQNAFKMLPKRFNRFSKCY